MPGLFRKPPQPHQQQRQPPPEIPAQGLTLPLLETLGGFVPDVACGFEDAAVTTHWTETGGPHALDTAVSGLTGAKALRIDATNDTTLRYVNATAWTARAVTVARLRFRLSALPSAALRIWKLNGVSVYDPYIYVDSDNRLYFSNGGTNATGPTISANTWYTVLVAVDGANQLGRWTVDGSAQPDPGAAGSADTHTNIWLGKSGAIASGALSMYYDDVAWSDTWADYPPADGYVNTSDAWVSNVSGAPALFAPTLTQVVGAQTITLGLLDASAALYAPTVTPGPVGITVPFLDAGATLYAPTLTPKNTITLGLLDASAALYAPTVANAGGGVQSVTLGLLDSGSALYPPAVSQTFYMATGGSDAAAGTFAAPWASLQKFIDTNPPPGSRYYLRGGNYDPATDGGLTGRDTYGNLIGTANAPILISAYPGETPVFVAPAAADGFFKLQGNETSDTDGVAHLIVDGIHVTGVLTTDAAAIVIGGAEPTYVLVHDVLLRNLYMTLDPATTGNDHLIGIVHNASNITVEDSTFIGTNTAGQGGDAFAIYSSPLGTGILIQRCIFANFTWRPAIQTWDYAATPTVTIQIKHCSFINNTDQNAIDLRYHYTALVQDCAFTNASGSASIYDPNNSADTTLDHNFYSQAFTNYYLNAGETGQNAATDGKDAGAKNGDWLTIPLLDSGPALYAPTVVAVAPTITVPLLDASAALYAPTLTPKNLISLGLLDASAALYAPTVTPKNTITVPLLDASAALYAPTLLPKNAIVLGLLDAGAALYAPNISHVITVPLLDASAALYAPALGFGITVPLLDAGAALYAPTVAQASGLQSITVPLLDASPALYPPVLSAQSLLSLPLLDASAALYTPTFTKTSFVTIAVGGSWAVGASKRVDKAIPVSGTWTAGRVAVVNKSIPAAGSWVASTAKRANITVAVASSFSPGVATALRFNRTVAVAGSWVANVATSFIVGPGEGAVSGWLERLLHLRK